MEDLAFQVVAAVDFGGLFTKFLNVLSVALGLGLVKEDHKSQTQCHSQRSHDVGKQNAQIEGGD